MISSYSSSSDTSHTHPHTSLHLLSLLATNSFLLPAWLSSTVLHAQLPEHWKQVLSTTVSLGSIIFKFNKLTSVWYMWMAEVCCSILESFISKILSAQHRIYSSSPRIGRTVNQIRSKWLVNKKDNWLIKRKGIESLSLWYHTSVNII